MAILSRTDVTLAVAIIIARDHHLTFYDALIVAAATEAGCDVLYSEDLQKRRRFGGMEVRNPF
jgi:predicted nucleic acid-binding protein